MMTITLDKTDILESSSRAFREAAAAGSTKREIVIIEAGWGSSGYYSEQVLERDIPRIFPVGSHMYLDHPTRKEDSERPERSVRDLVGVVAEAPRMSGIASVAVCEIFEHWVPVIDALAEHIGLSIRAFGTTEQGAAGGKEGPLIKNLTEGMSIDFVTLAGAGGKIGPLSEAARAKVMPLIESAKAAQPAQEALDATLRQNLEKAGEEKWGSKEPYTYVYIEDFDIDENWAIFSVRPSGGDRVLMKIAYIRNTDGDVALSGSGEEVERETTYVPTSEPDDLATFADSLPPVIRDDESLKEAFQTFIQEAAAELGRPDPYKESGSGRDNEEDRMSDASRLSELEESVRQLKESDEAKAKEIADLKESEKNERDRADRAEEGLQVREAGRIVSDVLDQHEGLPKKAAARVIENALRGELPTDSDGKLDKGALEERARAKLREEVEYIGEASGRGKVRGAGSSGGPLSESSNGGGSSAEEKTALQEAFEARGLSESAAKAAAEGR
jgi:hypothetical protein